MKEINKRNLGRKKWWSSKETRKKQQSECGYAGEQRTMWKSRGVAREESELKGHLEEMIIKCRLKLVLRHEILFTRKACLASLKNTLQKNSLCAHGKFKGFACANQSSEMKRMKSFKRIYRQKPETTKLLNWQSNYFNGEKESRPV